MKRISLALSLTIGLSACSQISSASNHLDNPFIRPSPATVSQSSDNLWNVLGDNLKLHHYANTPQVKRQIAYYTKRKAYLSYMAQRAKPFLYYVYQQTKERKLPVELALLPFIESSYKPTAYSTKGAAGLWQIMPGTGSGFGLKQDWWYDGRRDVFASTQAALDYLSYLLKFFDGNWLLAFAAYDSGPGTVQKAIRRSARRGRKTSFWGIAPMLPRETRLYVPRLLALATIISDPKKYGVTLPPIKNAPYLAEVNVGQQIALAKAAKLAGISVETLIQLNPGYNRWATDPSGPFKIILPMNKVARFKKAIKHLPKNKLVTWERHKVKSGESLSEIAKRYQTRVQFIKSINKLKNNTIRIGQELLIPFKASRLAKQSLKRLNKRYSKYEKYGPQEVIHKVKKGDTLWVLAKHYRVKPRQIRFWNHLKGNDLKPGSNIVIWKAQTRRNHPRNDGHRRHYTVRPGDNLWLIAKRLKTSVKRIERLNHFGKKYTIRPGEKIVV